MAFRRPALLLAALAAAVTLTGCESISEGSDARRPAGDHHEQAQHGQPHRGDRSNDDTRPHARKHGTPISRGSAAATLATLPVKGRAPMTGYDRDQFGMEWHDSYGDWATARNGCDTRNDILGRDLGPGARIEDGTNGCVVAAGNYTEPYSGLPFEFIAGSYDMDHAIDIDHVVALGNVWTSGGWRWDEDTRALVANDPLNLLAVSASLNRQKSDANAAEWLPPSTEFRCQYVARQIAVKAKYDLAVTGPEKEAMERVLDTCPGQPLPDGGKPVVVKVAQDQPATPDEAATPTTENASDAGGVHYANCDAARAAGASPVLRGAPGYGSHLDRDGDGSACE